MPVGNVNSQERGAGARYNDGKVPLELIPVWVISDVLTEAVHGMPRDAMTSLDFIQDLELWQSGKMRAADILVNLEPSDLEEAARVFGYGAKKYAAWNWIKGMPWSVPLGCALRHAFAILRGEELDPESGLPHRGHLVCNLIMLAQFERTYPEGDDRPVKWLSTDVRAAPTGGADSPAAGASQPESETGIEQPTSTDPWFRKQKEIPVAEGQRMYEQWLKSKALRDKLDALASETLSTPTSDSLETSSQSAGPSPSSPGFDPAD